MPSPRSPISNKNVSPNPRAARPRFPTKPSQRTKIAGGNNHICKWDGGVPHCAAKRGSYAATISSGNYWRIANARRNRFPEAFSRRRKKARTQSISGNDYSSCLERGVSITENIEVLAETLMGSFRIIYAGSRLHLKCVGLISLRVAIPKCDLIKGGRCKRGEGNLNSHS